MEVLVRVASLAERVLDHLAHKGGVVNQKNLIVGEP